MKHFVKPDGSIWAFAEDGSEDEFITDDMTPLTDEQLAALRTPSTDQVIARLEGAVQLHIDSVAQAKGYDSAAQCISYINSTVTTWKTDATKMNKFRDDVWSYCQTELATAQVAPTKEALIAALPAAPW